MKSRYNIEIVDLVENPQLAAGDEIIAIPTLVRRLGPGGTVERFERALAALENEPYTLTLFVKDHPPPSRMLVGDMSNHVRILLALDGGRHRRGRSEG